MEWFIWSTSILRLALGMVEMEHSHVDILASIKVSCVRQVNVYVCICNEDMFDWNNDNAREPSFEVSCKPTVVV